MKTFFTVFLCTTFLFTPLILGLIKNSKNTSVYFNMSEEELSSEKEIKAVLYFDTIRDIIIISPLNSCKIFSKNLSKHELIPVSIFIPPPELV